jgi:Ca2+:H+ antiporter
LTTQQPSPKLEPLEALSVVRRRGDVEKLSVGVAIVLVLTYVAGLFFSLRTHKDLFNPEHAAEDHVGDASGRGRALRAW